MWVYFWAFYPVQGTHFRAEVLQQWDPLVLSYTHQANHQTDRAMKMITEIQTGNLDCKEIQPVHSEGDQPWDFFGGNDAEAETPILWPPHAKS